MYGKSWCCPKRQRNSCRIAHLNRGGSSEITSPNRAKSHSTAVLSIISRHGAERATLVRGGPGCVYKVIFEDQNFRVIDAVRKKGVHDKLHSHPVPSIVYHLTDCTSLNYGPDGKPTASPSNRKAGTAQTGSITPAHSVENVGPEDCHQIFVERK